MQLRHNQEEPPSSKYEQQFEIDVIKGSTGHLTFSEAMTSVKSSKLIDRFNQNRKLKEIEKLDITI